MLLYKHHAHSLSLRLARRGGDPEKEQLDSFCLFFFSFSFYRSLKRSKTRKHERHLQLCTYEEGKRKAFWGGRDLTRRQLAGVDALAFLFLVFTLTWRVLNRRTRQGHDT